MDTQYRKNLKAVLTASKDYTDSSIEKLKWELGTYDLSVETDSTVAYTKTIPANTIKGRLNYIGGASKVSENTFVIPNIAETTTSGITWKVQNGIFYFNGTANASFSLNLLQYCTLTTNVNIKFFDIQGTSTKSSITQINSTYSAPTTSGTSIENLTTFRFITDSGQSFTNYSFKIMIVSGTTPATSWSLGFENIRSAKTTSVVVSGNLANTSNVAKTSTSGVTYKCQNGTITLGATATANTRVFIPLETPLPPGTYSYNQFAKLNGHNAYLSDDTNTTNLQLLLTSSTTTPTSANFTTTVTMNYLYFYIPNGSTFNSYSFTPMIIKGSTAPTTYQPYIAPITKAIPSEIQALEGYGLGIDDTCYNYVDLINKKFINKTIVLNVKITSIQNAIYSSSNNLLIINNDGTLTNYRNFISNNQTFEVRTSSNWGDDGKYSISLTTNDSGTFKRINIRIPNATSKQDYIDYFTNNPLTIQYEGMTPIETDISQYIDDDFKNIDTTNMGTITFENEFGYAVPSEIDYLIEEVKA